MSSPVSAYPAWVQDAIFYQVFPDRFAIGSGMSKPSNLEAWDSPPTLHGYKGGDLRGVAENLDYLQDLGVNALYLNPVFASGANHRYHTHDYFSVDPLLGGNAALDELLTAAHAREMRVILDGVFNHSGRGLLQFHDILENGEASPYVDWFHINGYPLNAYGPGPAGYDAWWGLPALPKFNTDTPAVREFLLRVGEHWLEAGVDGWRLDVPNEIDDDDFWREFRSRCRAVNPDAYLVGEIWDDGSRWLKGDIFDGVMNYALTRNIFGLVGREIAHDELSRSGLNGVPTVDAAGFAAAVNALQATHPDGANRCQLNLLGSHDTPRLLTSLGNDESAVRLAWLLLFAMPGAPCVYYGDEIGMAGGHDPACRAGMPWGDRGSWNEDLRSFIKALISTRKAEPLLRRGAAHVTASQDGVVLVRRHQDAALTESQPNSAADGVGAGDELYVAINATDADVELPAEALTAAQARTNEGAQPTCWRDLLTGREFGPHQRNGRVTVPARGGLILRRSAPSG